MTCFLVAIGSSHNFAGDTVNPCKLLAILLKNIWPRQFKEQDNVINSALSVKHLGVQLTGKRILSFHINSICRVGSDQLNVNLNLNLVKILKAFLFVYNQNKNYLDIFIFRIKNWDGIFCKYRTYRTGLDFYLCK